MQILLVAADQRQRLQWRERLQVFGSELVEAGTQNELELAFELPRFALAIFCMPSSEDDQVFDFEIDEWNSHCHWSVASIAREQVGRRDAIVKIGFQDCWTLDDCSDELVTSRLKHAAELEGRDQRLAQAQKLESIGELAAGIAHEINTPIQYVGDNTRFIQDACVELNNVLLHCGKILAELESGNSLVRVVSDLRDAMEDADTEYLSDEIPSAITQTLEGVERVAKIVRAMKEFSHPGVSEMTNTDLAKAIENTVTVARNEWKYVADLETDFDPDLPPVPCLPGELNQVMLNMIVNAAHAIASSLGNTPEAKGKITISTKRRDPFAEIRIRDSGVGIEQENVEKIFKPFFTTKAPGKGTGQGLAIAHSVVVDKHHGSIGVESAIGEGTCFIIRIPLNPPTSMKPVGSSEHGELTSV